MGYLRLYIFSLGRKVIEYQINTERFTKKINKVIRIFPYSHTSENTENIYALRGYMFNVFKKQKYIFLRDYFSVYYCWMSYPNIGKEETWEVVWSVNGPVAVSGSVWILRSDIKCGWAEVLGAVVCQKVHTHNCSRRNNQKSPMLLMEAELEKYVEQLRIVNKSDRAVGVGGGRRGGKNAD